MPYPSGKSRQNKAHLVCDTDHPTQNTKTNGHTLRQIAGFSAMIAFACFQMACVPDLLSDLEEYSRATRALISAQQDYIAHLQKATKQPTLSAKRNALRTQVLPALASYQSRLQQIRPKTPKLRAIHQSLLAAYQQWQNALQRFTQDAHTDAKWVELSLWLQQQAEEFTRRYRAYRVALKPLLHPKDKRR